MRPSPFAIKFLYSLLLCFFTFSGIAQKDSIIFKNKNFIVGEISKMDRAVLVIETDFSDSDFQIEWPEIAEIYTTSQFIITLKNREEYAGTIEGPRDSLRLITNEKGIVTVQIEDIVLLKGFEGTFKDSFFANIDLGFSLTKANNLRQFSTRSNIGYSERKWMLTASINSLVSNQDGQEIETSRTDARVTFKYSLPKGWFAFPEVIFFSNNEINLNLRSVYKLGAGYYIFKTNKAYWGALGGLAYTIEDYKLPQPNRSSAEAFIGTDLNFYNIGDFNFALNANGYPSLTEKGRFRADLALDIKYDLPLDFYIKVGTTYNYDNQPGDGVSPSDYVFQTGFGYEF